MPDLRKIDAKKIVEEMDRNIDQADTNLTAGQGLSSALAFAREQAAERCPQRFGSFDLMAGILHYPANNSARWILNRIMREKFNADFIFGLSVNYAGVWTEKKYEQGELPLNVLLPACYLARVLGDKLLGLRHVLFGMVSDFRSGLCSIGSLYSLWLQSHKDYFMNDWQGTMEEVRKLFLIEIVEQIVALETRDSKPISDEEFLPRGSFDLPGEDEEAPAGIQTHKEHHPAGYVPLIERNSCTELRMWLPGQDWVVYDRPKQ